MSRKKENNMIGALFRYQVKKALRIKHIFSANPLRLNRLKPLLRFLICNTAYRANKIITKAFTALAHPADLTSRIPYHQGMIRNISSNRGPGP